MAALAAAVGPVSAKVALEIAADRPGGPWRAFALVLAKQLEAALPGARVSVARDGNGYWNPIVVNARRADFALAHAACARWAYRGDETAYGGRRYANLRAVLGGVRPVWLTAMLHRAYIRRTGHRSVEQALTAERGGPRIVTAPAGGTVPIAVDMILAAMGTSRDLLRARGGDILQVAPHQIPAMMRQRRADLYFEAADGGGGDRALRETALGGSARLVDLPEAALAALKTAGLAPGSLPHWFEGQGAAVSSADLGMMVIVHRSVPSRLVYALTRMLVDRRQALAESHPAFRGYDPRGRWSARRAGIPLHPGAARFLRERGWIARGQGRR